MDDHDQILHLFSQSYGSKIGGRVQNRFLFLIAKPSFYTAQDEIHDSIKYHDSYANLSSNFVNSSGSIT